MGAAQGVLLLLHLREQERAAAGVVADGIVVLRAYSVAVVVEVEANAVRFLERALEDAREWC